MAKRAAFGTRLRYIDPDDSGLVVIYSVADITGPEISVETVDVTTHDSPDRFAEFIAGMASGGDVSFDLVFDPDGAGHARILDLVDERETIAFQLLLPRPAAEFVTNGAFASGASWTAAGSWAIAAGKAGATVVSPAGADTLTQALTGLIIGERYRLTAMFAAVGTGTITVEFAGDEIGSLACLSGGIQTFEFIAGAAAGNLVLTIDAPGPASASIDSLSIIGIADDTDDRFDFSGVFTKAGVMMAVKDALKASISIKVSGAPQFTPPA